MRTEFKGAGLGARQCGWEKTGIRNLQLDVDSPLDIQRLEAAGGLSCRVYITLGKFPNLGDFCNMISGQSEQKL